MPQRSEYFIWKGMIRRCCDPSHQSFHNYGGRGITVAERWLKFENFLSDMGDRPPKLTLERIDNNRGYEPSNCKWITYAEQAANKRPRKLTIANVVAIRADPRRYYEIARDYGVTRPMIGYVKRGMSFPHVITPSIQRPGGTPKLTDEQVRKIRKDTRPGSIIAKEYGVVRSLINGIRRGVYRKNVA